MVYFLGIFLAFLAFLGWGFGDFFIQKTTRTVGSWKTLFYICLFGAIVFFPFVAKDLFLLTAADWWLLLLLAVITLFTAGFDFEALRQGKIAVVETIMGLELPLTVALSIALAKEQLSGQQLMLIFLVFIGIILASQNKLRNFWLLKNLEKGVVLAGLAAICLALMNYLVGISSRQLSPIMTIWFTHTALLIVSLGYLSHSHQLKSLWPDFTKSPWMIINLMVFDNFAWLAFATSMTLIPIAIATTISESYIALAVLLGLLINREKIKKHQAFGIILTLAGVFLISLISG